MTEVANIKQVGRKTRDLNRLSSNVEEYFVDRAIAMWPLGNVLPVSTDALTNVVKVWDATLYARNINAQTLLAPTTVATGLSIAGDLTATDGFDIGLNEPNQARARHVFKVDSEAAGFFIEAQFTVADVSGVAELLIGFRKLGASAAAISSYTDYAYVGINGASIYSRTRLNNGTASAVDSTSTVADGVAIVLRVDVSKNGVTKFWTNVSPTDWSVSTTQMYGLKVDQDFKFDTEDLLVPNIRFIHDTDVCDTLVMNYLKCGYLN